jgi:predicted MarR family transcription regulator
MQAHREPPRREYRSGLDTVISMRQEVLPDKPALRGEEQSMTKPQPKPGTAAPDGAPANLSRYRGWHLGKTPQEAHITELEFTIMRFREAFEHWVLQASRTISSIELNLSELNILHTLRAQPRPTSAASIARMLNRDDIPNIQYTLRKLIKLGLVKPQKDVRSKSVNYAATDHAIKMTDEYGELKRELLVRELEDITDLDNKIQAANRTLTMLTALYEELARVVATYSPAETEG